MGKTVKVILRAQFVSSWQTGFSQITQIESQMNADETLLSARFCGFQRNLRDKIKGQR